MIPRDQANQAVSSPTSVTRTTVVSSSADRMGSLWAWLVVSLPIIAFAWVWAYYAVNVRKWDDYALRAFLYNLDQETTLSSKLYQLFRQHNEHRIVYDRIITYLDYWLFGKLNFLHLMIVGNLSLLGVLAIFATVLRRARQSVWFVLPIALFLFNLSQWENAFWGMAALQNFTVVLWVLLSIHLLTYTSRWPLAMAIATLATITSGNGLLIWPIGCVLLLLQRRFRPLTIWSIGAVGVIGLYFLGYEKPAGNPPTRGTVTDLLKGWFAFNGAAGEVLPFGNSFNNSVLVGALMTILTLVIAGVILRRQLVNSKTASINTSPVDYFFLGSAAFLIGTGVIVAWSRVGFGLDLLITSRYKVYSLALLALLYTYLIATLNERIRRPVGLLGVVAGLCLAWLSYVAFLDETIWWRHWMLTNQFNWTYSQAEPIASIDPVSKRYNDASPAFYDTQLPVIFGPATQPVLTVSVSEEPVTYTVRETTLPSFDLLDHRSYVVTKSAKRVYLFPAAQQVNKGLSARLLPTRMFGNGFTATFFKGDLAAGSYEIQILTVNFQGQWGLHPTNQTLNVAEQAKDNFKKNW